MTDIPTPPVVIDSIPPERNRLRSGLSMAGLYVLSLGGAVLLSGALVAITGWSNSSASAAGVE